MEDMRTHRRPGTFDIVLDLYTSFGFFSARDDDKLVLDNVYSSLKPGGRLLMDMMGKEILTSVFQERSWSENNRVIYLEERKIEDGWEMIRDKCTIIQCHQVALAYCNTMSRFLNNNRDAATRMTQ